MTQETKFGPDWELIEREYRAGVKSVRQIATEQGLTHGAINKRIRRDGWERDLSARIRAKADAIVSKSELSRETTPEKAADDRQIVEANAEQLATILTTQRYSVRRAHSLCMKLFAELEATVDEPKLFSELGEFLREEGGEAAQKRSAAYEKVITLTSRVDNMKKLGDTLRALITVERDIYGLSNPEPLPPPAPAGASGKTVVSDDPISAARAYQALMN